jgi:hypothetical protein
MSVEKSVRVAPVCDLRDQVVNELATTLVELDQFKSGRSDHQELVHEVDRVQRSLRWALLELAW